MFQVMIGYNQNHIYYLVIGYIYQRGRALDYLNNRVGNSYQPDNQVEEMIQEDNIFL